MKPRSNQPEYLPRIRALKTELEAMLNNAGLWKPMKEILREKEGKYTQPLWLHAPDLIDADFNPTGCAPGYWQDGEGWMAAGWDSCNDVFTTRVVHPTHYAIVTGPRHER